MQNLNDKLSEKAERTKKTMEAKFENGAPRIYISFNLSNNYLSHEQERRGESAEACAGVGKQKQKTKARGQTDVLLQKERGEGRGVGGGVGGREYNCS